MPVKDLDHVNLRTANLAGMVAFYEKVLGLTLGPRPAFGFDGAWLYSGERATVHLIAVPQAAGIPDSGPAGLQLEHFAFTGEGLTDFMAQLRHHKVPYRPVAIQDFNIVQINLHDVDGNHLHIDFAPEDGADLSVYEGD
jgi:catechol 2,3-dioxygenase-like lactoylglutathione lyase family enzyme